MINSKRLAAMARKWHKIAGIGRRRVSTVKTGNSTDTESCSKSVAEKGHFVLYTIDRRRFVVPLQYLKSPIFVELLRMSEDAFGITSNGPITLPCDGVFMENVISLVLRRNVCKEAEKDLVSTMANQRCSTESSMFHPNYQENYQHILVHGY